MKNGKLFILLKALKPEEWKGLRKMVDSPIYNTNKTLITLFNQLRSQRGDFDSSQKGKEQLFKRIWPGKSFDNYKIHRLFTQMTQVVEEYFLLLEQRGNELERKKRLLNIYGKRNLISFFERAAKDLKTELDVFPFRDLEYYQDQIMLNEAIYFHPLNDKYDLKDGSLDRLINSLDYYFILAKMRYGLSLKNRERILAKPGKWRFMENLQKEERLEFIKEMPLYQLYQKAFALLGEDGIAHFKTYELQLFENITILGKDRKILFFSGLNFINRQVNKGLSTFSDKALEWYQFGLHNGLLIENEKMNEVTFGNIVVFGCRQKRFDWTKDFINSYQHLLDASQRMDIVTYHLGLWHFYQQDFENAFSVLLNYTFIPAYFLKSRLTAIRALFEKFIVDNDYYELLVHQINAFEMAMRRRTAFSKSAKEPIMNCLFFIKTFTNLIWNNKLSDERINTYLDQLEESKKIATRHWLIAKLKQLRMT